MFTTQIPRQFTLADVTSLNSNQYGVYGIYRQNQWIYIGKGDIRTRLMEHLRNRYITAQAPTHFVAELWLDPHMSNREKELILACRPLCNQKIG